MQPSTRTKPTPTTSTAMLNLTRPFRGCGASESPLPAISQVSTEQRMEVVPITCGNSREPDIIYLKQPIMNPVGNATAYSIRAYAKFPDDLQEGKDKGKKAKIPVATTGFVKGTPDRPIVNEHTAKRTVAFETTCDQATVIQDEKGTEGKGVSGRGTAVEGSDEVKDYSGTIGGAESNTTIEAASTVTATAITDDGATVKITVDTNKKLTFTQKKVPNGNTPRYVVNAPVEIKIILQGPTSSNNSHVITSSSSR